MKEIGRTCICFLLAGAMLMSLTACSGTAQNPQPVEETQHPTEAPVPPTSNPVSEETLPREDVAEEPYDKLLRQIYLLVCDPDSYWDVAPEGQQGILESARNLGSDAPNAMGYLVEDISGDGIPELLVGENDGLINAVYTLSAGQPQLVLSGRYRSGYAYMGSGHFFYYGSNGAAETGQGIFYLSEDGRSLQCQEFLFTHAQGEEAADIRVYRNSTGSWEPEESQLTDMTAQEFWDLDPAGTTLPLTLFAYLEPGMAVSARYLNDDETAAEVILDTEYADRVLFTARSPISQFTVLKLTLESLDDAGTAVLSARPASDDPLLEGFSPDCPIILQLSFGEILPTYGITYVDENGQTRCFALQQSGRDGAVLMLKAQWDGEHVVLNNGN